MRTHHLIGAGFLVLALALVPGNAALAVESPPLRLEVSIPLGNVTGRLDHLAVDVARRRLFVAELGNDSVGVVDLRAARLLRTVTGLKTPQGIGYVASTDEIYVANGGDGSIRILRGDTLEPGGQIALGDDADNVRTTERPARVFVGFGDGALAIIDPVRHARIADIRLKAHPEGFQILDGSARALVNVPAAREIALVDLRTVAQSAAWLVTQARDNFPMAVADNGRVVWVAARRPGRLMAFDAATGVRRWSLESCEDADDVMVDAKRQRIYVSCGAGFVDTWEFRSGSYVLMGHQPTVVGARTALFVPELDRLYVAVRATPTTAAAIRVYRPVGAQAAADAAVPDCPLAQQPYSTRSPLLDLLIDPAAHSVLEREAPAVLKVPFGPDAQWPTTPPTFAAILTPALVLKMIPDGEALGPRLDAALAAVALTPEAIRARCARYDSTPPTLAAQIGRPAILVFDKINGYRDGPSVEAAAAALRGIAARHSWALVSSGNGAVFNAHDLARFDVVVWNNVSGDVLTVSQQNAFKSWMQQGGGFVGIHGSGGDPVYFWDWYADTLVGARFKGHPMKPQFQEARVVVEGGERGITAGLGPDWRMTEEWYSFLNNPRTSGAHVLATLDESTYSPVGMGDEDLRMGDHPIAWSRCIGNGRSFYTALGHRPEVYTELHSLQLLEQGITWAAGLGASDCLAGMERPAHKKR